MPPLLTLHSKLCTASALPPLAPGDLEHFLLPAVAVLSIAALIKKFLPPRRNDDAFATRLELQHELNSVRDKIDARFLALGEKLDGLSTRISELTAALARLDERTK